MHAFVTGDEERGLLSAGIDPGCFASRIVVSAPGTLIGAVRGSAVVGRAERALDRAATKEISILVRKITVAVYLDLQRVEAAREAKTLTYLTQTMH